MYKAPEIMDFGSIADHTFGTARKDTCPGNSPAVPPKSTDTTLVTDCFDDFSHPAGSP